MQDEILTNLARIADLKVISRTSTMQDQSGVARNLRKIAQQLGVANVVEGSVQHAGNRVRVNAQLIDARTDRHLWAQTYDRDLATYSRFKVISRKKSNINSTKSFRRGRRRPSRKNQRVITNENPQAKTLIATSDFSTPQAESLSEAVRLLNEAIERYLSFALAYYQL